LSREREINHFLVRVAAIRKFLLKIFLGYPIVTIRNNNTTGKENIPITRKKEISSQAAKQPRLWRQMGRKRD
jgi:hypothetical protein